MTWMIMRSSSGGLREAPAGQGPCPAPGPSTTIYYFHYLLLLPLLLSSFCWKYIMCMCSLILISAFYFLWKVFILDPTSSTAVHCTIWATFSVGPTIWEPCTCWTDFKGISMPSSVGNRPLLKKKCLPGFYRERESWSSSVVFFFCKYPVWIQCLNRARWGWKHSPWVNKCQIWAFEFAVPEIKVIIIHKWYCQSCAMRRSQHC